MRLETKHFIIIHNLDKNIISDFSKSAEEKYKEVYSYLNFLKRPQKKIKIVLCKTFKEYSIFTKKYLSWWRWSQAWGNSKQGVILNLKRIAECGGFNKSSYDYINSSFVLDNIGHELVHVFMVDKSFYDIKDFPAWLNEGLAEYFGANKREIKNIKNPLRLGTDSKKHLPTEEAYTQATNMVIFIVKKYGTKNLVRFLKKCYELKSFESAFSEVYKISSMGFESCFLKRYESKRRKT